MDNSTKKSPVAEWNIKICDFGLARSLVGVESDKIITKAFGRQYSMHHEIEEEQS